MKRDYYNLKTLKGKVWHVLEKYPSSRNSDTLLTNLIWGLFYEKYLIKLPDGKVAILLENLYELPTQDDIKRIRAHIQNKMHRFPPTNWEVAKKRKWLEEKWRKLLGFNPELRTA